MADYEVIDNFLPEQEFNHIAGIIMGKQFAWHFLEDVAEKNVKVDNVPHFYLYHMLFEFWRPGSNFFSIIEPLLMKLQPKALIRIKDDTYGYCLDTAEPIGLKRLMARPVAKYTIAAQEKHEKDEKVHADD